MKSQKNEEIIYFVKQDSKWKDSIKPPLWPVEVTMNPLLEHTFTGPLK